MHPIPHSDMTNEKPAVLKNNPNNRTEAPDSPNPRAAILHAIDKHADDHGRARAGRVFEDAISDSFALADLASAFDDLVEAGLIYRPTDRQVARCHVEAEGKPQASAGPGDNPEPMARGRPVDGDDRRDWPRQPLRGAGGPGTVPVPDGRER